ncbi:MAG TPA: hypothetical protein VFQ13_12430 [Anaerolineales bacterium]|nr:hypothetical protein [Anaerolineales bacterium]
MNVNNEVFENKWKQIRAQSKTWWGLFTDADLEKVEKAPSKRDKYAMMLRVKYGYTHERAREEINKRVADLEANPPSSELILEAPEQQDSSKVSRVRKARRKVPKSLSDDNIRFE